METCSGESRTTAVMTIPQCESEDIGTTSDSFNAIHPLIYFALQGHVQIAMFVVIQLPPHLMQPDYLFISAAEFAFHDHELSDKKLTKHRSHPLSSHPRFLLKEPQLILKLKIDGSPIHKSNHVLSDVVEGNSVQLQIEHHDM